MIYTIGYEGIKIIEFIEILRNRDIKILIDVRELPISRKREFSKNNLKKHLNDENIEYFHFKDLGTPKILRDKIRSNRNYNLFFKEYKKLLCNKKNVLNNLIELVDGKNVCLICYEKDYNYCHRKILAEEIKKTKGISVCHI